jgi:hypothetical protein
MRATQVIRERDRRYLESSSEDEHQKVLNRKAGKYKPDEVYPTFKSKHIKEIEPLPPKEREEGEEGGEDKE